jgi:transglutaminase-like putative cysteine protease
VKYRVTHRTEYFYGETVPLCHNLIRLRPRKTVSQVCGRHELTIDPVPATRRDRVDFFGNYTTWMAIQQPHRKLVISATSEMEVSAGAVDEKSPSPAWDEVAANLSSRTDQQSLRVREYTFDSQYVPRDAALVEFARASFPAGGGLLECAAAFTRRIFKEFKFDRDATNISTPVLEVLKSRRGVCQDFAHLAIGCLRSLGLAARYVSGYLATKPPPGKERLVGADASHAWISVFIPEQGWVDFDPTNGLMPTGDHVTVGWARDYGDLSPVKGVMVGGDRHSLNYSVDVVPCSAE